MSSTIFSTYTQSENRVTSTILSVFKNLNSSVVSAIFKMVFEENTFELAKFDNQISGEASVPDGRISGLFDYYIETKIQTESVDIGQLERHLKILKFDFSRLWVLTPDLNCPKNLEDFKANEHRITWFNFDSLVSAINGLLAGDTLLLLDRERFLLSELSNFIIDERLIPEDISKKVTIVPAGFAYQFYLQTSLYICQSNRFFQPSKYMGFYANSEIKKEIPVILGFIDNLNIQEDDLENADIILVEADDTDEIVSRLEEFKGSLGKDVRNERSKYMILSKPDSDRTEELPNPVVNDKQSYSGKGTAYVMNQTYVNLDMLRQAKFTSEI